MSDSRNPALQKLLSSLSSYSPDTQSDQNKSSTTSTIALAHTNNASDTQQQPANIPGLGFLSPERPAVSNLSRPSSTPKPQSPAPQTTAPPSSRTAPQVQSSPSPVPDASTITTWPGALKHVTKHLAHDEVFAIRIRNLIATQHKHERQWHNGRQAVLSMQASRSSTSAQVSALLQSLGGKSVEAKHDAKVNEKELADYDRKVYASLVAMTADFDRQLKGLGVPFYVIKHDLVIGEQGREKLDAARGRIDRGELRELQQRMLGLLEDLFAE